MDGIVGIESLNAPRKLVSPAGGGRSSNPDPPQKKPHSSIQRPEPTTGRRIIGRLILASPIEVEGFQKFHDFERSAPSVSRHNTDETQTVSGRLAVP